MRVWLSTARQWKQVGLCVACVVMGWLLLQFPQAVQTGVSRGLAVCGQLLIPSLFPFLVLSGFVIRSGVAFHISEKLAPLMRRVFGLSASAAVAMVISVLGGYPAGANAVATLLSLIHI